VSGARGRASLAAAFVVVALVVLAALGGGGYGLSALRDTAGGTGRSLEALVRPPGRGEAPALGPDWRHTPADAVIFRNGYFCARGGQGGPDGRTVRLVLAMRELDALTRGSSTVAGPFATKNQAGGEC
jgi:hypothetical protein